MKKLFSIVIISFVLATSAQAKLIHYWHFNNYWLSDTTPIAGVNANYSALDTTKAMIYYRPQAGTSMVYKTVADYYPTVATDFDTFNVRMGVISGNAFRTRNPSDSMEVAFYMSTIGFKNIVLKYGTQASNGGSGQRRQMFSYSIDSGMTWRMTGIMPSMDSAKPDTFRLVTVSFSDTMVNNNGKFVFRITYQGSTTGTAGNNRFDNVSLDGDTIARTNSVISLANDVANTFTLFPNPASNTIELGALSNGLKTISLIDINGKCLTTLSSSESKVSLNIASYAAGVYFVSVVNEENGTRSTSRFVKE
jgi:hypothetical protein